MSRSFRTQKESVIAARRIKKDQQGDIILPRIIERKPAFGDIHPISKTAIKRIF
jgi:hypothetical protein